MAINPSAQKETSTLEVITSEHLGGGIRNDVGIEYINLGEAFDSLNEDSLLIPGTSAKRRGGIKVGSLDFPIRCIWEGKAWVKKRIVVAGGKIYDFNPPSTFTEIYDGFDGGKHDFVRPAVFFDGVYGGLFILMDGVNRPLYWDGIGAPKQLPEAAPIAKCGTAFRSYFIVGNLTISHSVVYDTGDQEMGSIATKNYSEVVEIEVEYVSGTIKSIIAETSTGSPNFDIHIFDTPPPGWKVNETAAQNPMNSTHHIFSQSTITDKGWSNTNLEVDFRSSTRKLYLVVYNDKGGSDDNIKIRIEYLTQYYNTPFDIQWCSTLDIMTWELADLITGLRTGAGRLSLHTREGGGIIAIIPFNRDVCMVYKDDGTVIALTVTGSSHEPFAFNTISEGLTLVSGNAILPWGDAHWALSTEGFLKITPSGVEMVEPYGKAKKIFDSRNKNWDNCHGAVLEHERRIAVSYPRNGNEDKDGVINYGVKLGTFDKWDSTFNVLGACARDEVAIIDDFSGLTIDDFVGMQINDLRLKMTLLELYGGDYNGDVWRLGWTYRDDTSAITASRESGAIRPDPNGKVWFKFIILLVDLFGDYSLDLEYRCDFEPTWQPLPSISLSKGSRSMRTKSVLRGINKVGDVIELRWANGEIYAPYVVRQFKLGYEKVGIR